MNKDACMHVCATSLSEREFDIVLFFFKIKFNFIYISFFYSLRILSLIFIEKYFTNI